MTIRWEAITVRVWDGRILLHLAGDCRGVSTGTHMDTGQELSHFYTAGYWDACVIIAGMR